MQRITLRPLVKFDFGRTLDFLINEGVLTELDYFVASKATVSTTNLESPLHYLFIIYNSIFQLF